MGSNYIQRISLLHGNFISSYGPDDGHKNDRNMYSKETYIRHPVIRFNELLCLTVILINCKKKITIIVLNIISCINP